MPKTEVEIEKLLTWAYRDELSKRQTSAAEGIWDRIEGNRQTGVGIDLGHAGAQRYAHFGLPDPDAEAIERAVGQLEDVVVDWGQSLPFIAGELAGLVSVNDFSRRKFEPVKTTTAGWTGKNGQRMKAENRPRDMLLVGALRTKALVTMHAIQGSRPDWRDEQPMPYRVQSETGQHPKIVGSCEGKNRYSLGSYCLLQWEPSPASIITARAEYAAWWEALNDLCGLLGHLKNHIALPPRAPAAPWQEAPEDAQAHVVPVVPTGRNSAADWGTLPLHPARGRMLAPLRRPQAGPVRFPLEDAV